MNPDQHARQLLDALEIRRMSDLDLLDTPFDEIPVLRPINAVLHRHWEVRRGGGYVPARSDRVRSR